ncbi:MAG: hypothetical protein AAF942_18355, partial [Pseudomonadota bacterium]
MFRYLIRAHLAVILLFGIGSAPALATSAAKEINSYNKIEVVFTKNAKKCGFESTEPFERNLKKDLAAVGVNKNDNSVVEILLEVGGIVYGALESQCVVDVNLDFRTTLRAVNITTANEAVRQAVDRLKAFPISLYKVGAFAVSTTLYTVADGRNVTKAEA